jgi:hypothetical protein
VSRVSEISRQYHAALGQSQEQYEEMYRERAEATTQFYRDFFHRLVLNLGREFRDARARERTVELAERRFGTRTLQFVAVDGTCQKQAFSDVVTFFGGAYGARGEVELDGGRGTLRYRRWSLDHDVSMVAWIPIPFARLEEVTAGQGEQFLVTEEERINLASVHVQVMQLAEVFLAYNSIVSSRLDAPQVLLLDLSPSSVLASVARAQDHLGLEGYPFDRRSLTKADVTVALAHPFSGPLGIPGAKKMDGYRLLVAELDRAPDRALDLAELASRLVVEEPFLRHAAEYLRGRGVLDGPAIGRPGWQPRVRVDESWAYVRSFFQNVCERLFVKKDPGALQYDAPDAVGTVRRRWLAPDDLGFLIGVGMRLLVEACWERRVLLYGVVKDSSSAYLTRNFLGVALETGFHPELATLPVAMLPWTDRLFCETLPYVDPNLEAPWCTVEFDSAFMTLHRERDPGSQATRVAGVMGRIVNQERLFARSLGQFFLSRAKSSPLMGHVVFLERLMSPPWDLPGTATGPCEIPIETPEIGRVAPLAWREARHDDLGQRLMMFLLSVLTRNHFAEAIGYPDPLHKADWGAKTIGRTVGDTIRSSARLMAAKPLSRTFRFVRDAARR